MEEAKEAKEALGYFGDIGFVTSDQRIMNFSGLKREISARYSNHEVIGQKPVTEFLGPSLQSISFTINLNGSFGVKPRDEMDRWIKKVELGKAELLVIGGKPLGKDQWVVKSVSQTWETVFNKGELFSGKIEVTLEEYIGDVMRYEYQYKRRPAGAGR
jgi:phage protein U